MSCKFKYSWRRWCAVVSVGAAGALFGCGLLGLTQPDSSSSPALLFGSTCNRPPNGCGPAGILGPLVPECPVAPACFNEACDQHDVCYRRCGIEKSTCDNLFFLEMQAACAETFEADHPMFDRCSSVAFIYAEIVDRLGDGVFQFTQALGCVCDGLGGTRATPQPKAIDVLALGPPFVDHDDDLLPDDWEHATGLDPNDPADAMQDFDGDGLSNLLEFIRDSDPFVPSAR
ncbi:MAG: hypothetical protein V3W34_02285 [Phycisphaerae bacterium]